MLQDQIKKANEEDVSTHIAIAQSYEKMVHILVLLSKNNYYSIWFTELYRYEIRLLVFIL